MTKKADKIESYEGTETVVEKQPRKKSALQALLGTTADIKKTVHLERFQEDGESVDFIIRAITGEKLEDIRDQCTHSRPGKGGKMESYVNDQEVGRLLVAEACIEPDFSNPELLDHYQAESPADCTQKALLAGEIVKLSTEIMALSGFDDDEVEAVKN